MSETRHLVLGAEVRTAGDFCIVGKALSYNLPSPDNQLAPGYREKIAPGCFRDSLASNSDVKCLLNHAADNILGRLQNKTLTLTDGPDALRFRVQLNPESQAHKDIYASVKRGDLNECSFAFNNESDSFDDDVDSTGKKCITRVIKKAKLIDVSIVTYPFYSNAGSTDAQARELRAAQELLKRGVSAFVRGLRKAARIMAGVSTRKAPYVAPYDYRGLCEHFDNTMMEAESALARCDDVDTVMDGWGSEDDWDENSRCAHTDHKALRAAHTNARMQIETACNALATAREALSRCADRQKK